MGDFDSNRSGAPSLEGRHFVEPLNFSVQEVDDLFVLAAEAR